MFSVSILFFGWLSRDIFTVNILSLPIAREPEYFLIYSRIDINCCYKCYYKYAQRLLLAVRVKFTCYYSFAHYNV